MKQKFINIRVIDVFTNSPISGLSVEEANGNQLNAVLQLAPANSRVEIEVLERVVDNGIVK